jgi:hypothetical protein
MNSLERAQQICQKLEARGVRATVDVYALNIPGVLVNMPTDRTNDLNCGVTLTWSLSCVGPGPGGDRTGWTQLETLMEAVEATLPIERSHAQPFVRPGRGEVTNYPSYEATFSEAL